MKFKNIITCCLFMLWSYTMQPMLINQLADASMALEEAYNNLAEFAFDVDSQYLEQEFGQEEQEQNVNQEEQEDGQDSNQEEQEDGQDSNQEPENQEIDESSDQQDVDHNDQEEQELDRDLGLTLEDDQEQPANLNVDNGNCSYSNTTTVPMVLSFVVGTITGQKQVAPQGVSYQPYPTTSDLQVTAHADLSPIARNYTNNNSYEIVTNNSKLNLVTSAQEGKKILNKTLWRMLISATSADGDEINVQLAPGQSQSLPETAMFVMIIPLIEDTIATPTGQQCVISNNKSAINLQFS